MSTNSQIIERGLQEASQRRMRELEAMQQLQLTSIANQPKNTRDAYSGKKIEYKQWCVAEGYPNDEVNKDKLLTFLTSLKGFWI